MAEKYVPSVQVSRISGQRIDRMVRALVGAVVSGSTRTMFRHTPLNFDRAHGVDTQGADSLQMEGTASDDALTAPAIIAPMRLELDRMRANPGAWLEANSTGHKFLLSDLIAAMQADMTRLGISDTEDLRTLGDSAIEALGGGTGIADALDVESVPAHADRVERLITLYESKLRSSQGAAQAASDIADTAR